VELIAVDVVAIEIGAIFLAMIAIAVVAFLFHVRLLERAVLRHQADLRARWAQVAATESPVMAEQRPINGLWLVESRERWLESRRAGSAGNSTPGPATRPAAAPRAATH
jgi:hypothetical protein